MSHLALHLLGPPSVEIDGQEIRISRRKALALLAYLAVAGGTHTRDALATLFWPEQDQSRARSSLRGALVSLRKALGEGRLETDRENVGLRQGAQFWLDLTEFQDRLGQCQTHGHPPDEECRDCLPLLTEATELYRDDFMAGFSLPDSPAFDEWQYFQSESLRNGLAGALERLARGCSDRGEYEPAIAYARRWVALDPLDEPAHRNLMVTYAASGQRAAALRQYAECQRTLNEELGVPPSAETTALCERILDGELAAPTASVRTVRGYELRERIGSGGFGEVFRAYQPSVSREVAVKVVLPPYANLPEFIRRFDAEARLVARLEHPHIVPLHDYWRDVGTGSAYLVMRWLPGGDLSQALRHGPWSPDAAARLLDQIAGALDAAHRHGVVHRDVKPENILLDGDGNAYLSDFGIAKILTAPGQGKDLAHTGASTGSDAVPGSLWYISPEQAQSEPATPRSDLYSLGVVMYEVLAGEHPFAGMAPADQLIRRLTEPLPALHERRPDLPPTLTEVLRRATAREPAQRYPDVLAFAADFREALSIAPVPSWTMPDQAFAASPPGFLAPGREQPPRLVFVARERELRRLEAFLQTALAGHGQVAFVTGGPGRGKTTLMNEFARRAMDAHPDLLAAGGNCNAFFGVADPYLPFRDALAMLCGDVEDLWAGGAITRDHARRLWDVIPLTARALLDRGPALIDAFVSGAELLSRSASAARAQVSTGWMARLQEHVDRAHAAPRSLEQIQLFDQYANVLRALAERHPLLILLDDMQWADTGSAGLLFHLGQRLALAGSRMLIVCAYRPEELAIGTDQARTGERERHPLEKALGELKRQYGDVWVDLAQVDEGEGRAFVDALVDTEPNRLAEDFRLALFQHTRGHPLFTVELLRAMQERGDLTRDAGPSADDNGAWVMGPALDWDTLPPRVEGVIQERFARLSDELREILSVASVEGELFTAQVTARVQGIGEREVLRALSQQAERRHRLVQGRGEIQVGTHRLSRYQFAHTLFQRYLYNNLGEGERRLLHREIALSLEDLCAGRTEEIAVSLARHFELAGMPEHAVQYLLQAGDQARALYAHAEAERHYQQAVRFLRGRGQDELTARTLMKLGLVYTAAFEPAKAQAVYAQAFALWEKPRTRAYVPQLRKPAAVLRLAIEQPPTLDPGQVADDVSRFVAVQLFEGLVRIGRDHNVLPAVAARWEISDDGTRYVFHLRDDVRWNDETPLTAADFAYAWARNLDPSSASPLAHLLFAVKNARALREGESDDPAALGVTAVDDHRLEIDLEGPTAYLPYLLAHPVAYPLPRWALEREGQAWTAAGNLVSNGAYALAAWEPDQRMVLQRNPFYQGAFAGNVERVECPIFAGFEPALQAYTAGEVDAVSLINADSDTVARAHAVFGDELVSIPHPVLLYLMFRADGPPFDDGRVRKALIRAVDREAMVIEAFDNRRLPATGGFVPPAFPGHSPDIGLAYDPEGARRLLAEAGFPHGRGFPSISWLHAPGPADERVIPFLRSSWRDNLGLNLESKSVDFRLLFESLAGDLAQLTVIGWSADYPDPDSVLRVTFDSREGVSNPRWRNARFDQLVEQAARVTDHARRMSLYREADRILVSEDAVVMPLAYGQGRMLIKPWVTLPRSPSIFMPLNSIVVERRAY
jgi:ABC-type oligopeptide transport system substrate-binding subunit/DNA-binding SARP family transcriptional activator